MGNRQVDLRGVKTGVFGVQGSGKTFIVEHKLIRSFKRPLVYLLHPEDFQSCGKNVDVYIPTKTVTRNGKPVKVIDKSQERLNKFLGAFLEKVKQGKYDGFILDEASTFLPKDYRQLQRYENVIDLVDNHRHYKKNKSDPGLGFVYMARRPQTISTDITETSEYLFLFAIDGVNVKDYFKRIHKDYDHLMDELTKQKHNYIFKHLGEEPKLMSRAKVQSKKMKGGKNKKNG